MHLQNKDTRFFGERNKLDAQRCRSTPHTLSQHAYKLEIFTFLKFSCFHHHSKQNQILKPSPQRKGNTTSPALSGVRIRSEEKPLSRAYCATGEGISFLPLSLLEGG